MASPVRSSACLHIQLPKQPELNIKGILPLPKTWVLAVLILSQNTPFSTNYRYH